HVARRIVPRQAGLVHAPPGRLADDQQARARADAEHRPRLVRQVLGAHAAGARLGEQNAHPLYNRGMPSPLAALSPLDGRYARTAEPLRAFFSEQALIRYRVKVELAWLEALAGERGVKELKGFSKSTSSAFRQLVEKFSEK